MSSKKLKASQIEVNKYRYVEDLVQRGINYALNCRVWKYADFPDTKDAFEADKERIGTVIHDCVMMELGENIYWEK